MRKVAWVLVVLLFLASAVFFVRYVSIYGQLTDPKVTQALRQLAAYAHLVPAQAASALATVQVMRQQADFSLCLSIATGLLATLAFIVLAATHRRRSRNRDYEYDEEEDAGPQTCPECDEPIKGFEISC